jgi:DNA-binding CsgD family transcriptional regulator
MLTQRELEILKLIAAEHTSHEIASKLYLSNRTIESHRLNLMLKLGVKNTAGLVRKAIQLKILS